MNQPSHRFRLLLVACLAASALAGAAAPAPRPNIVVILADDMGFSDIGCYGGEILTPNLDALAQGGLRFSQFYNMARCCPTRAALLTGLYPHQAGVGHMMEDRGPDGYRGTLNRNCLTIAEALRPAGYHSYAVGKWHVTPGHNAQTLKVTNNWPLQRGFERFYGTIHGAGSYWDPSSLVRDNTIVTAASDADYQPQEFYYTDAISDHAVRFIRDHARERRGEPFFLYTAFTAAHWPMHARESDIAKYRGRYHEGYAAVRGARWARLQQLGLVAPGWEPAPLAGDWSKARNPAFEERCMEVYAAMVDRMDQGIGRMIAELKAQGQFENTLILYLQDNGGCAELVGRGTNAPARGDRPTLPPMAPAEQQFNSQPRQTRDGWPVRQGYGVMPGPPDTYVSYGREWANVSNTPFREYKHWTHEGGISTPCIAHWPAGIAVSRRNQIENQPAHLIDIMATCLDIAGGVYPKTREGRKIKRMEGVSLRPLFAGKSIRRPQPIFWEHEGNRAVRDGKWKLVGRERQAWELYDMERDRTELHDLAGAEPSRVKQLAAQWDAYAARANVLPLGAWRGKETRASLTNRFSAGGRERPNFLFLFSDDQTFRALGALGELEVRTPNLDRLARRGMLFTHCFNQGGWSAAVCIPSRTMLVTGRTLWQSRGTNGQGIASGAALWGETLGRAGYATFMAGKWHLPEEALQRSFQTLGPLTGGFRPSTPAGGAAYSRPAPGNLWTPDDPKWGGHWITTNGRTTHSSVLIADAAISYLRTQATHATNPFFMYVAFNAPHDPRQAPREFLELYPPAKLKLPPNFLPRHPFPIEKDFGGRDEILAPYPRTPGIIRVHLQEYYAMVTHLDAQIGRVLDALDASGQAGNTVVIFTSDQGLAVGQHGLLGKQNLYDHSLRMPFLMAGPGIPKGGRNDALFNMQSLFATTCEMARVPVPATVQFPSLVPLITGATNRLTDALYAAFVDRQRAVRTERWKLIRTPNAGEVQLFDVKRDPWETRNLAADPKHAATLRTLEARLGGLMQEMKDPLPANEGVAADPSPARQP